MKLIQIEVTELLVPVIPNTKFFSEPLLIEVILAVQGTSKYICHRY
jgi:hypothetical protein